MEVTLLHVGRHKVLYPTAYNAYTCRGQCSSQRKGNAAEGNVNYFTMMDVSMQMECKFLLQL